jgi:hypothetical protein
MKIDSNDCVLLVWALTKQVRVMQSDARTREAPFGMALKIRELEELLERLRAGLEELRRPS